MCESWVFEVVLIFRKSGSLVLFWVWAEFALAFCETCEILESVGMLEVEERVSSRIEKWGTRTQRISFENEMITQRSDDKIVWLSLMRDLDDS